MDKRRNNIDYLRIVSMLFIICHHCIVNDFGLQNMLKFEKYSGGGIGEVVTLGFFNSCVVIGVNLFFLMSGYLRIKFKWQKIINLIIKTYIIYWLIAAIGLLTGYQTINFKFIKNVIDPLDLYWFIMTYVLLYFCSPLLNMIIQSLSLKMSKKYFIGICVTCFIYGFLMEGQLHLNNGYSFLMAAILYILGGLIKKWEVKIKSKVCGCIYLLCSTINTVMVILFYLNEKGSLSWKMYAYNNLLIVIETLAVFLIFCNMECRENKWASKFAAGTFMTYLLHSTSWLAQFRGVPINYAIAGRGFYSAVFMLPIYAFAIYVVCVIVDLLYERLVGKGLSSIVDRIANIRLP